MPDREKVIKWADICLSSAYSEKCNECPYQINHEGLYSCVEGILRDTLALLKEQKAVEPKKVKGYNPPIYTLYEYECEKCKSPMMSKQPFCMGCGMQVKWE